MKLVVVIGVLAILLTTIKLLPQIIYSYKTKQTRDISLAWEELGAASSFFWLLYGYLIADKILLTGSTIQVFLFFILIFQKKIYS